ncbi:MAG: phenylalanine 4-monooxygenase [Myxococcus sp.]|nr:phenylalanine 4-monooxygenase [Myxococcus sp.]
MLQPATATPAAPFVSTGRAFTDDEHATWGDVVRTQRPRRLEQLVPMFSKGLAALEMDRDTVPDLEAVNARLRALTGWRGEFVKGLEDGRGFYSLLRDKKFPIGNFVRDRKDLNYTPEPDIIHDLYGHVPFHADAAYADYCHRYGEFACRFLDDPERLRRLERYFWFTIEFGLVETPAGRRIFGAGIASSIGECVYALSDEPEVVPFDVERICAQEFRIDQMQKRLFVLPSIEALYESWPKLQAVVER